MAFDALLKVTGPANAPGNPIEAAAITATADGTPGYVYVGKYRSGTLEVRLGGAFDRTTGDETLQATVWEATDAAGTGAAQIAAGSALAASHRGNTSEEAANTATGSGNAAGTLSHGPARIGFQTGAGGFVKVRFVAAGTTPSAAGVSADIIMSSDAFRPSGV